MTPLPPPIARTLRRITPRASTLFNPSDLGAEGEWKVAKARLSITSVLALVSLLVLVTDPSDAESRWSALLTGAAALVAFGIVLAARRPERPRHFALITCLYDVSIVSLLHVIDLVRDHPAVAVNGRVTFSAYFLALVGTIVRADRRVCAWAGLVAALQYAGIIAWSAAIWPAAPSADVITYGQFDLGVQVERLVTLLLFAWICGRIAAWALTLRASATHDALTGVLNRRVLEDRLQDEMLRARRAQHALSVAMIDVDHFKEVNDRYGHHVGDEALLAVARFLRDGLRRTDLLARWGGEEFAIIFPETTEVDAYAKVERMRTEISAAPVLTALGIPVRVTISAGVASLAAAPVTPTELLQLADQRLLEAKREGRNRVRTQEMTAVSG